MLCLHTIYETNPGFPTRGLTHVLSMNITESRNGRPISGLLIVTKNKEVFMRGLFWFLGGLLCIAGLLCSGCTDFLTKGPGNEVSVWHEKSTLISPINHLYSFQTVSQGTSQTQGIYLLIFGEITSKNEIKKYAEFYFIAKDSSVCHVKLDLDDVYLFIIPDNQRPYCKIYSMNYLKKGYNLSNWISYVNVYIPENKIVKKDFLFEM